MGRTALNGPRVTLGGRGSTDDGGTTSGAHESRDVRALIALEFEMEGLTGATSAAQSVDWTAIRNKGGAVARKSNPLPSPDQPRERERAGPAS